MNYLETIKIENGKPCHLEYHIKRMEQTIGHRLLFPFQLQPPPEFCDGIVKCRMVYHASAILSIEYLPYTFPVITSLQRVVGDKLDYHFKYEDRSRMNALKSTHCTLAGEDILILQDGFVTDTSFCNVVFENRRGLFTPSTPLLHGTKRQYLLDTGRIQACLIRESEILQYENVYLINAMIDLQDRVMVPLRR